MAKNSVACSCAAGRWPRFVGGIALLLVVVYLFIPEDVIQSWRDSHDTRAIKRTDFVQELKTSESFKVVRMAPFQQGVVCLIGPRVTELTDGSSAPYQNKINEYWSKHFRDGLPPRTAALVYVNDQNLIIDRYDADEGVMFMTDTDMQSETLARMLPGTILAVTCATIERAGLFKLPSGKIMLMNRPQSN